MQARAMIVVMRSPSHKKEALIRMKRFLSQKAIKDVSINDCFPNEVLDIAKQLARYGAAQRRAGGIIRYRVINKQGRPVLQTLKEGENFKDNKVADSELEKYKRAVAQPMETDIQETNGGARRKEPNQKRMTGANTEPIRNSPEPGTARKGNSSTPRRDSDTTRRPVIPQPGGS